MRKITFLLVIFLLVVSLLVISSCKKNTVESNVSTENSSDYFIFVLDGVLVKINCATGTSTPLCQDSICEHKDLKCPFSCSPNQYTVTESGNVIYFVHSTESYNISEIRKYNIKNGDITKCHETSGTIASNVAYKEDLYFTEVISETKEEVTNTYNNVYRISSQNTVTKLNSSKINGYLNISSIKNDRMFFYNSDTQSDYNTTLDYTDEKNTVESDYKKPDILYEKDSETEFTTIKSTPDDSGNRITISNKAGLSFIIDDYIYYIVPLDEKKLIFTRKDNGNKYYLGIENKFYRSKLDGSENGMFVDFGENNYPLLIKSPNYNRVKDNYMLVQFTEYGYDKYDRFYAKLNYCVLNLKTGGYKMVT